MKELAGGVEASDRVRAPGAGRRFLIDEQPGLLMELDDLVEPSTRGDPTSPLRWTSKSTENLARALVAKGFRVSADTVGRLLKGMDYSLQAPAIQIEGAQHPDRNEQFEYINALAKKRLGSKSPVISVDSKKKELVNGEKANGGREYQPAGNIQRVDVHDCPDPEIPKAVPYGVYDLGADAGWMSVGDDHETAAFAVNAIRRWWEVMGAQRYPGATQLMITADAGGSNSYRNRSWKVELGRLAAECGLDVTVCHYPPGTSKWNKIEHRLFSFITKNWRGRPLTSYRTIVELVKATKTKTSRSSPSGTRADIRPASPSPSPTQTSKPFPASLMNGTASGPTRSWPGRDAHTDAQLIERRSLILSTTSAHSTGMALPRRLAHDRDAPTSRETGAYSRSRG